MSAGVVPQVTLAVLGLFTRNDRVNPDPRRCTAQHLRLEARNPPPGEELRLFRCCCRLPELGQRAANPRAVKPIGGSHGPSRGNDNALGPCVDQRAAMANALHPDAIVSIHADGGPPEGRGFHVNYSNPPLNDAQAGPAIRFAQTVRDQLFASGVQPSTYRATDGLYGRADLAGLNLAQYPSIVIELKNAEEAAVLSAST